MTLASLRMSTAPILIIVGLTGCGGGGSSGPSASVSAPVAVAPTPVLTTTPTPTPTPSPTPASAGEIHGSNGNDTLMGTEADDVMYGESGDDVLFGLGGNDRLDGGVGTDTLHGGPGDDTLYGFNSGQTPDTLFGDAGADVFYFANHVTSRTIGFVPSITGIIGDFESGRDKLYLRFTGGDGDGSVHWLDAQPFTGTARLEVRMINGVLQIDADGDRIPELQIQITGAIAPSDISVEYDPFGY